MKTVIQNPIKLQPGKSLSHEKLGRLKADALQKLMTTTKKVILG